MVIDWAMSSLLHTELSSGAKIMICVFQDLLLSFVGLLAMALPGLPVAVTRIFLACGNGLSL